MLKATLGRDLDPLGRPFFLGGSARPRSPWGIRPFDCQRSPHGSGSPDGPGAAVAPSSVDDVDEGALMAKAARLAWSGSPNWRGSKGITGQMSGFTSSNLSLKNSTDSMELISAFISSPTGTRSGARGRPALVSRVS